ncbi:MAG: hypothetical protein HOO96_32625 [Polyangiaceae bacterium]|nr:hypothetical protein [Polyangiaceae bacterium]
MRLFAPSVLVLWALTGCAAAIRERFEAQEIPRLKERAAFDLQCPKEQLTTAELGSMATQGVSGCGKRATYVQAPSGQWIMNTEHQNK